MALRETKFALLTQKRLIWGVLRTLGDFSLAHAINQLRWASFVSPERCTAAAQQRSHRHGGQRTLGRPRTHKFRMQFTQCRNQHTPKNRRISTIRLQDLKYSPGNCMRNCKAPHAWRAPEGPTAVPVDGSGAWPGFETTRRSARQEPLVWRAPEGPEGTGGLRGAAPNEVRPPSLAGGRALRRPEHPWGHKQHHTAPPQQATHNETRPRPVSRPRPRRAQSALLSRASASDQAVMST